MDASWAELRAEVAATDAAPTPDDPNITQFAAACGLTADEIRLERAIAVLGAVLAKTSG